MLTESLIAASSAPPKLTSANASLLKDAGLYFHTFQPQPALHRTFKNSQAGPNCVAASESHVFAAQLGKAVVHVYNREDKKQEATVPFAERIHSIGLALDDTVLVAGTEGGRLVLWETISGRVVSTSASHLQPINALAVDLQSHFVLTGAGDASVLVWSLYDLLSFDSSSGTQDAAQPRHSLSGHNGAITALATGHSATFSNRAFSAAKDNMIIVWSYTEGTRLHTILLASSALCIALDPVDRAAYAGFEDGSVQRIDLLPPHGAVSTTRDEVTAPTTLQPPPSSRWSYPSTETTPAAPSALSLAVSYDGLALLSGHTTGAIHTWDVATGRYTGSLAQHTGAPITNILFEKPTGFLRTRPRRWQTLKVVKPRLHEPFSGAAGGNSTSASGSYALHAKLPTSLEEVHAYDGDDAPRAKWWRTREPSSFRAILESPGFSTELLEDGIRALAEPDAAEAAGTIEHEDAFGAGADTIALADPAREQADALQARLAHLQGIIAKKDAVIEKVQRERDALALREREGVARRAAKVRRRERLAEQVWEARARAQQGKKGGGRVNGHGGAEGGAGSDISTTSASDEASDVEREAAPGSDGGDGSGTESEGGLGDAMDEDEGIQVID